MLRRLAVLALVVALALPCLAAKQSTADQLKALLHEFLEGVSKNDKSVYDRFFHDDLIYTRSAGVTITKTDILKSLDEPPQPDDPKSTYDADDITVHAYGNMAVMNFRLIQRTTDKDGKTETHYYRNTGTFLKRNGRWQVVAWQATRVPEKGKEKTP
ncbi:MAG: nuclear transport factor 2 family protein [Terriglobales bacterium]